MRSIVTFVTLANIVVKRASARLVSMSLTLACIVAVAMSVWPSAIGRLQTEDTNHDGRPDIWRYYDARGELTHVTIDSNFDGHPDREEEYRHGSLSRRDTDRNFDHRVDLVEDFDPSTHEHVKSTVDADFDGRADLLVLFQDGRPVHSEWAKPVIGSGPIDAASPPGDRLIALVDPFDQSAAFGVPQLTRATDTIPVGVDGLVVGGPNLFGEALPRHARASLTDRAPRAIAFSPASPRAPPSQTL